MRSTIQRFGNTTISWRVERLTISTSTRDKTFFSARRNVGPDNRRRQSFSKNGNMPNSVAVNSAPPSAVLNVGGVHDGVHQHALRVDEDVTFLPLILAGVVARRIVKPPFSAS